MNGCVQHTDTKRIAVKEEVTFLYSQSPRNRKHWKFCMPCRAPREAQKPERERRGGDFTVVFEGRNGPGKVSKWNKFRIG